MEPYINNPLIYFIDRWIIMLTSCFSSILFYVNNKRIKLNWKTKVFIIVIGITIPTICQLFGGNESIVVKLIFILLMVSCIVLLDKNKVLSNIPLAIISVSVVYCLEYISALLSASFLFLIGYTKINIITTIISCVVQVLLLFIIFFNKRVKRALSFFTNESYYSVGLLLSSFILSFSLSLSLENWTERGLVITALIGVPLALTGLILWIRSIVQRYYKNKLQDRANEYTKQEIEDKDKRIERLESEVSTLAKQLHRDNHLLSSLDCSAQTLAECDSDEQRAQIIEEIHTMCRERNELIAKEQQQNKILPSTGIALIDGSLSEMYVKAAARGISFDLTVSEEPYYLVNNIISQTELQTLLCDHIKDAIIAVESAGVTNGKILVTIEKNDGIFEIAVRDNGVDFDAETLAKLGREQITTHADDGGSGIGFMTTFETLRKTKGSLIITEYEQKTPFSKSVAFVFDGLNRFIISSYRKEELENTILRDDVMIVDR